VEPAVEDQEALGRISTRRDAPRVAFARLLETGLLLPGQRLFVRGNRAQAATVLADGTLRAADGRRGSIHSIGAHVGQTPACNGWGAWHYADNAGMLHPIDALREQVRRSMPTTTVGFVLRYATVASEPTGGTDYAVRIRRAAPPG
jgi:modification methylase